MAKIDEAIKKRAHRHGVKSSEQRLNSSAAKNKRLGGKQRDRSGLVTPRDEPSAPEARRQPSQQELVAMPAPAVVSPRPPAVATSSSASSSPSRRKGIVLCTASVVGVHSSL